MATGQYLARITEAAPGVPLQLPAQIAVDSSGDVYVSDIDQHVVEAYGPGHYDPSVRLAEPSGRQATGVVLNGAVNPLALSGEGAGITECRFEYVSETVFKEREAKKEEPFLSAQTALCEHPDAGEIPANEEFNPVHADVGGCSGETYRYRLTATTGGALGGTSHGEVLSFTALHAPRILSSAVGDISSSYATLRAGIDPLGADTSYHFEYSSDAVTWVSAPVPDGSIGSGGPTGSSVKRCCSTSAR